MIQNANNIFPSSCQIGFFFTNVGIIVNLGTNGNLVSKHFDRDDFMTVLFHISQPLHGGRTDYYTVLTNETCGTLA